MPFAAAYVQAKQTFSKQIWDRARNKSLLLLAAVAGGFALLDVPALLEKILRAAAIQSSSSSPSQCWE